MNNRLALIDRDTLVRQVLASRRTREDVRRLVRVLQALAVDLPEGL